MEISELMKKVNKIKIKTNRQVDDFFGGAYHSLFKGKGLEFADLRKYEPGDDYRDIDWKVTAKFNVPYVKMYEEERELTVIFVVDISASMNFSSLYESKKNTAAEIVALLSIAASKNKDKVGALFFGESVEKYIKPSKGIKHVMIILRDLLAYEKSDGKTNYEEAINYVLNVQKKKAVVYFICDLLDFKIYKLLSLLNKKHDVICVKINDVFEENPPKNYVFDLIEYESGEEFSLSNGVKIKKVFEEKENILLKEMKKRGIDIVKINTADDYVKKFTLFFKQRAKRR